MLYPIENKVREVKNLNGIWNFKIDYDNVGIEECWQKGPLKEGIPMAVPASYNDLFTEEKDKEHVGYVWYERTLSYRTVGTGREWFSVLAVPPTMQLSG